MNAKMNLMKKFMNDRKHLKSFQSITYHDHETRPYIYIDRPEVLAGFAGYLKYQCLMYGFGPKVFCRGQINDYPSIPSLFRDDKHSQLTNDRIRVRWNAYKDLVSKTPSLYKASRFKDEDIDPIFQHYGLKTPWLDLVDNVFIALWFATKKYDTDKMGMARYTTSRQKYGRIYFYAINKETKYYDLRERHSSLTLRLHVQHGISMTRNTAEWNILNRNLDDYLIATVNSQIIKIGGLMATYFPPSFFFHPMILIIHINI